MLSPTTVDSCYHMYICHKGKEDKPKLAANLASFGMLVDILVEFPY